MGRTAYVFRAPTVVRCVEGMRLPFWLVTACVVGFLGAGAPAHARGQAVVWHRDVAVVGYGSPAALRDALRRHPAEVLRRIPALRVAEVRPRRSLSSFAAALRREAGILYVSPLAPRTSRTEPAVGPAAGAGSEWQWAATHADTVPPGLLQAASAITVAV